jgi:hypothetical protein
LTLRRAQASIQTLRILGFSDDMNVTFTLDTVVEASREHLASELPDETIILHLPRSAYFGIDGVGRYIWDLIKHPTKIRSVRDALVERYDAPIGDIERDLFAFLEELRENELITVQES